jgi:rare lipoprotein A (peptidoglycan hydrolase)
MKKTLTALLFILLLAGFFILSPRIAQVDEETVKCINTQLEEKEATTTSTEPYRASLVVASWYDYDFNRKDQKCRSNDCYSMFNSTCASRDYERGTILTVRYKDKEIKCRVNDYGPADLTRDIDLSSYAFSQLEPLKLGLINVEISEE